MMLCLQVRRDAAARDRAKPQHSPTPATVRFLRLVPGAGSIHILGYRGAPGGQYGEETSQQPERVPQQTSRMCFW